LGIAGRIGWYFASLLLDGKGGSQTTVDSINHSVALIRNFSLGQ